MDMAQTDFAGIPSPPYPPRYLAHYGLHTVPFPMADPNALWLGRSHRAALWTLSTALEESEGIVALTGDPGTGKTSLANHLSLRLARQGTLVGRIPDSGAEPSDLFRAIGDAFGIKEAVPSKTVFVAQLRKWLASLDTTHKKLLLIIDNAH